MDPSLTEEQQLLQDSARDFLRQECPTTHVRAMEEDLTGYSPELWQNWSLSAAHGNDPASLAGWIMACCVCEPQCATRYVFPAHGTKKVDKRPVSMPSLSHMFTSFSGGCLDGSAGASRQNPRYVYIY
jgi:hypothetical protein